MYSHIDQYDVAFPVSLRPEDQFAVISSLYIFFFHHEEQEDVPLSRLSGRINMVWDQESDCDSKKNVPWDSSCAKWTKQVGIYLFIMQVKIQCI